ncbi:MAG: arylsulfatase A-like enzyme [Planctomycetota bacterium]|jgi:arylsulfatase A-like enzyme
MILMLRFLLLLAIACTSIAQDAPRAPSSPPNIVLIYADDLGYTDLACYGSSLHLTPHLDQLAAGGKKFTNAYANAPNCAPSRACLISGQYGPRHGVYTVGSSKRGRAEDRKLEPPANRTVLADEVLTLPELLRSAGYVNGHIGKWHLGDDPRTQGFDVNVAGNKTGHPKSYFSPYRNPNIPDGDEGEYLTDRLTLESIRFIEEHRTRPFFLYLSHYAVHTPIQAKEGRKQYFKERNEEGNPGYAAMVESLDESVGRIIACLERLNLRENTLVIFTSDNGGYGPVTSMAPLRGSKGMLYEGGIREPFLINWPGKVAPGSIDETPIIGTDLLPTLVKLAGASLPKDKTVDGVDLTGIFLGQSSIAARPLFWHFPAYLEAGRALRKTTPWRTAPVGAIRLGSYKLIEHFEDGRLELYDLENDLAESTNLAETLPSKTSELLGLLQSWRKSVGADMPTAR